MSTAAQGSTRRSTEGDEDSPQLDHIGQNVEAILELYRREEENISAAQRLLERISGFMGRPVYLACILFFIAAWLAGDLLAPRFGWPLFDPPPFFWLQGILGLGALLTTTIILIKQVRLAKFEEQRAHLDTQVTLLTEQKAAKIIELLEELRRDLPNVRDRHDPEAAVLKQPADPGEVLATLDERRETGETGDDKKSNVGK
jgi:uncharacterized membrane protein